MSSTSPAASLAAQDGALSAQRTEEYPNQVWYFLASFIGFVAVFQFGSFLHARYSRHKRHLGGVRSNGRLNLRRIPSAIVNTYRVVAFRWTLSIGKSYTLNLAEVLVTAMYMAVIFTWAFINTTDLSGHKYTITYWSNRCGAIAASQIPLITALGTKNNVISLITGVSYDKLNFVHRMTARVIFVLVWVHAGSKIHAGLLPVHGAIWEETWLRLGLTAGITFTLLILVSLRPVRARVYEVFFYAHFALVLTFLIVVYFHTREFGVNVRIWPAFVIWGADRLIRLVRVVIFNHSYFGFKSGSGTLDARTELLSDNFVRVTMRRPPHFHWAPGQTAYLIMPGVSTLPFEAHPFTIASYDSSENQVVATEKAGGADSDTEKASQADTAFWKELVFFINVHEGFTKRLAQTAAKGGGVKVFIDGPYGPSPDLGRFDTCVLVAGGSGVSYTLPVLLDIMERVRNSKSDCRRVVFVWAVRDATHIHWISNTLTTALARAPAGLDVDVRLFATGDRTPDWENESLRSVESTESDLTRTNTRKRPALLRVSSVALAGGRPNLATLLGEEAGAAERMAVCVCGSQAVASAVRKALRFPVSSPASVLRGGASVTLHVESFGYA